MELCSRCVAVIQTSWQAGLQQAAMLILQPQGGSHYTAEDLKREVLFIIGQLKIVAEVGTKQSAAVC